MGMLPYNVNPAQICRLILFIRPSDNEEQWITYKLTSLWAKFAIKSENNTQNNWYSHEYKTYDQHSLYQSFKQDMTLKMIEEINLRKTQFEWSDFSEVNVAVCKCIYDFQYQISFTRNSGWASWKTGLY